jgi:hypothetical protein
VSSHNFFSELKRRNVYKVSVADAIVGWLLVQVATQVFPFFEIPNWAIRLVILGTALGFALLIIAWAFEQGSLTPFLFLSFFSGRAETAQGFIRLWSLNPVLLVAQFRIIKKYDHDHLQNPRQDQCALGGNRPTAPCPKVADRARGLGREFSQG